LKATLLGITAIYINIAKIAVLSDFRVESDKTFSRETFWYN
jgi:hypothetical protein